MKRPLVSKRPVGPFIQFREEYSQRINTDRVFNKIELACEKVNIRESDGNKRASTRDCRGVASFSNIAEKKPIIVEKFSFSASEDKFDEVYEQGDPTQILEDFRNADAFNQSLYKIEIREATRRPRSDFKVEIDETQTDMLSGPDAETLTNRVESVVLGEI